MQGRKADTLDAARRSRGIVSDDMLLGMPGTDWYVAELYAAMVRFGMWDAILAEPAPNAKLTALSAGYHYAQATAHAAKDRIADARQSLAQLEKLAASAGADDTAGLSTAGDVYAIAVLVAQARIAEAAQQRDKAIDLLTQAVAKEDGLAYDEPADWFFPVRHLLGAALLAAGKAADAEAVYREDLRRHPENGWALFGLAQALKAQSRNEEAQAVQMRFASVWKDADIVLTASAF